MRASVIVVGHSVALVLLCACILPDTPPVSSPPDTFTGQRSCTKVNRFCPRPQLAILFGWYGGCLSLVLVHHCLRLVNVGQVGTLCPLDALVDFLSCDFCCHCPSHVCPLVCVVVSVYCTRYVSGCQPYRNPLVRAQVSIPCHRAGVMPVGQVVLYRM